MINETIKMLKFLINNQESKFSIRQLQDSTPNFNEIEETRISES